jgi:hypothetical protein
MANWHGYESAIAHVDAGICETRGPFFDENKANADLIVAAAEMFDLLKAVASCPQAMPWLARLDAGETSVAAGITAVLASVEGVPTRHRNRSFADCVPALRALLDWGREHTSPRDANSPHKLLVAAADALAKAEG